MKLNKYLGLMAASVLFAACQVSSETTDPESKSKIPEPNSSAPKIHKASSIPERQVIGAPDSGVELGMGWDSRRGVVIPNRCIDFAVLRSTGQTINMDLSEVSDKSEMMEKMKVSAAVSVKSMFASGSAKTSFAKNTKMTSSSTNLLLRTTVDNSVITIAPPAAYAPTRSGYPAVEPITLPAGQILGTEISRSYRRGQETRSAIVDFRQEVKNLLGDPDRFRETCGDYFVASIYSGAEMFTVFNFTSSSKAESSKVSASVKGSVGMVKASVSAATQNSTAMENTNLSMRFMQVGGGASMIPMDRDSLNDKLEQLAIEADLTPKFHTMEIRSYREIPGAAQLIYGSPDAAFEVISDYYWFLSTFSDEITNVLENPNDYYDRTGLSSTKLAELQDDIIVTRRALAEVIEAYLDGRHPEQTILDAVNYQWFESDTARKFILDFDLPGPNMKVEGSFTHPCAEKFWFDCVVDEFMTSVPYGNPNTLRLLLPLSRNAYGEYVKIDETDDSCEAKFENQFIKILRTGELAEKFKNAIKAHCTSTATIDRLEDADQMPIDAFKIFQLEHLIARQSDRVCALEPRDNECLTNLEISELAKYIPVNKG